MIQGPLLIDTSRKRKLIPLRAPTLLITLEPRGQVFFRNLKDLLWRRPKAPLALVSRPASFWPGCLCRLALALETISAIGRGSPRADRRHVWMDAFRAAILAAAYADRAAKRIS